MPMGQYSRYRYNTVIEDSERGVQYLDEREPFRYRDEDDNRYHTAEDGDTWWGLAHRYFAGIPRQCGLWWLICEYQPQPIVDPTIKIMAGQTIIIPSMRTIRMFVFSETQRRYH